jgi:hypothetical protein
MTPQSILRSNSSINTDELRNEMRGAYDWLGRFINAWKCRVYP